MLKNLMSEKLCRIFNQHSETNKVRWSVYGKLTLKCRMSYHTVREAGSGINLLNQKPEDFLLQSSDSYLSFFYLQEQSICELPSLPPSLPSSFLQIYKIALLTP